MTAAAFTLVLLAAALHAAWNAVVKGSGNKLFTTVLVTGSAALLSALVLPFIGVPDRESWPYLAASIITHFGYFALVANAYRTADMSLAYPLMRGTAPILVALIGTFFLADYLTPLGWTSLLMLSAGILGLALLAWRADGERHGAGIALLNAGVIASYTLIDGAGVRLSGSPAAYTLSLFFGIGAPMTVWAFIRHGRVFVRYAQAHGRDAALGGAGSLLSYGLVLWAMMAAPVALVAALRETAILFAMGISFLFLGERLGRGRLIAAGLITAGAVALRLA